MDIVDEAMELASQITLTGAGGDFPFIMPTFCDKVAERGLAKSADYTTSVTNGRCLIAFPYEGIVFPQVERVGRPVAWMPDSAVARGLSVVSSVGASI